MDRRIGVPPTRMPTPAFVALVGRSSGQAAPTEPPAVPSNAASPSPRVRVYESVDGTVLLAGFTLQTNRWVAEYRCLAEDFDERCVLAMERRVKQKERKLGLTSGPQLVTDP